MAEASEPYEDAMREWFKAAQEQALPKVKESALWMGLNPGGEPDAKFCLELGAAIMYDKPLIVLSVEGRQIPERLRRIADMVIETEGDVEDIHGEIMAALTEFVENLPDS